MEVRLILKDAYFSRTMVALMETHCVNLECVEYGKCRTLKVNLSGSLNAITNYMAHINAVQTGHMEWSQGYFLTQEANNVN